MTFIYFHTIKNISFLFLIVIYSCSAKLSNNPESNYFYRNALNYIKHDSTAIKFIAEHSSISDSLFKLNILVSPKIIPPNLAEFGSIAVKNGIDLKLNDRHFNYSNSISDSLIKYEDYLFYEPYINNEMISLTSENKNNAIIFFSKVYDNFLTAILFYRDEELPDTEIPRFQTSLSYLIVFNDKKIDLISPKISQPFLL